MSMRSRAAFALLATREFSALTVHSDDQLEVDADLATSFEQRSRGRTASHSASDEHGAEGGHGSKSELDQETEGHQDAEDKSAAKAKDDSEAEGGEKTEGEVSTSAPEGEGAKDEDGEKEDEDAQPTGTVGTHGYDVSASSQKAVKEHVSGADYVESKHLEEIEKAMKKIQEKTGGATPGPDEVLATADEGIDEMESQPLPNAQRAHWSKDIFMATPEFKEGAPIAESNAMKGFPMGDKMGPLYKIKEDVAQTHNAVANRFHAMCGGAAGEASALAAQVNAHIETAAEEAGTHAPKNAVPSDKTCSLGLISSGALWDLFWVLPKRDKKGRRVKARKDAGFPPEMLTKLKQGMGGPDEGPDGSGKYAFDDTSMYAMTWRAWQPHSGGPSIVDAIETGELATEKMPEYSKSPTNLTQINFLVKPEKDRNWLLWQPIKPGQNAFEKTENLATVLGSDYAVLVDSHSDGVQRGIAMPVYPLRGANGTIETREQAFRRLKCHGTGDDEADVPAFLGVAPENSQESSLTSDLTIQELDSAWCTVQPNLAGVLAEPEKQGFIPHFRNFKVLFDFKVIDDEISSRSNADASFTYDKAQDMARRAVKSAADLCNGKPGGGGPKKLTDFSKGDKAGAAGAQSVVAVVALAIMALVW